MRAQPQMVRAQTEAGPPRHALRQPVLVPVLRLIRWHEELHLHLLELAGAEDEVAGGDLVAEALADLGDPEGRLLARELEVVLEVEEDPLGRLGPQVDGRALLADRTDRRLEHQVEVARLGKGTCFALARMNRRLTSALRLIELVRAESQLARAAVDQRVGESR